MSFSLARLRTLLLPLLIFSSFSFAKEDSLFTSSVTYCEPPETLLIQQFDIAYFAANQSVSFNVSVASVQANVNVSANLLLNVYGIRAINITLDLCSIFNGALCPLPMYNFTGADSLPLPQSLGVQDRIPGIAFKIPDLEGVAQLILTEVSTGDVKACVQATLSNGWTMHQPSVEWVTGGITLATLCVALWQSMSLEALLPFRLIDLLFLYQTVASTSFLSLNYPSAYRAFTLNFAWAMGLFATSSTSSLQPSIDRMRHLTGGTLANSTSTSAVGLVNRKLSPYNFITSTSDYSSPLTRRATEFSSSWARYLLSAVSTSLSTPVALDSSTQGEVQTVTTTSSNVLQAGIPIYVNTLHIATANAFMTTFFCALILIACALAIIRLVCNGLMIAFAENLNVSPIARTVIGLVIAVIFSVTILITYVNILLNSGIDRLWTRGSLGRTTQSSAEMSIMEKGDKTLFSPSSSSGDVARPPNPTPHSSNQIDPNLLQPFPVSPTETEITTSAYMSNRTSGTTTLGSTLPRRWSVSPLSSPTSPTNSSQTHEPSSFNSHNGLSSRYSYSDTPSSFQHGHTHT
ncbi:hypothetical protein H0H92_012128 [Tricholoma furcatifolium]|nr:hypothetical protein H0H92_012128 [Tricholoma furcatifolium]